MMNDQLNRSRALMAHRAVSMPAWYLRMFAEEIVKRTDLAGIRQNVRAISPVELRLATTPPITAFPVNKPCMSLVN